MGGIVVVGDSDTHGGIVTSGDSSVTIGGIPVAYVGSTVSSDSRKGHSGKTIIGCGCSGRTTVGGKQLVMSGAPVSCGATVIASHTKTTIG